MRIKTLTTITGLALLLGAGNVFGADPAATTTESTPEGTRVRASTGDRGDRGQFSEKDWKFITEAARGGMAEVELGQLAKDKASDPNIKSFGDKMVADHKKANDELKQIVARKGATLPANLTHHDTRMVDRLQKATGADFDKEYAKAMVKDHETDVKEFEKAAQSADDPDIKAFAQKTLPTLQEHLKMAEQNAGQLNK